MVARTHDQRCARRGAGHNPLVHRASAGRLRKDGAADPALSGIARHRGGARAGGSDHVHAQGRCRNAAARAASAARGGRATRRSRTCKQSRRRSRSRWFSAMRNATGRCKRYRSGCGSTPWTRSMRRWRSSCRCWRTASRRQRSRKMRRVVPPRCAAHAGRARRSRSSRVEPASLLGSLDNDQSSLVDLLAGLLPRREQWLGHLAGRRAPELRAELERALEHLVIDELRSLAALWPADLLAELNELLAHAAANLSLPDARAALAECFRTLRRASRRCAWPAGKPPLVCC